MTTGASNDLQQVRNIARRMVAQWGFANAEMGAAPVAWETGEGNGLMIKAASVDREGDRRAGAGAHRQRRLPPGRGAGRATMGRTQSGSEVGAARSCGLC